MTKVRQLSQRWMTEANQRKTSRSNRRVMNARRELYQELTNVVMCHDAAVPLQIQVRSCTKFRKKLDKNPTSTFSHDRSPMIEQRLWSIGEFARIHKTL